MLLLMVALAACDSSPVENYEDDTAPPQLLGLPGEIVTTSATVTVEGEVRDNGRVEEVGVAITRDSERVVRIRRASSAFAIELAVQEGVALARVRATDAGGNTTTRLIRIERQRVDPEPISYEVVRLGSLGGDITIPADVNNRRQVVGSGTMADGSRRAFLWEAGEMTVLDTVPHEGWYYSGLTLGGRARAINDAGVIVGSQEMVGVVWEDGVPRDLGLASSKVAAWPADVNESGVIVGGWWEHGPGRASGAFIVNGSEIDTVARSYSRATTGLAALNDQGLAVGALACEGGGSCTWATPFIYRDGVLTSLGEELGVARPADINSAGQVVGSHLKAVKPYNYPLAFMWQDGEVTPLGALHWLWTSEATAVNESGEAVGLTYNPSARDTQEEAFIWRNGYFRSIAGAAGGDWKIVRATAINDSGDIAALARHGEGGQLEAVLLIPIS